MAATTTTALTTAWTDLGAGPLEVQTNNQSETILAISDAAPDASAGGFFLQGNSQPLALQTTAHVWARLRASSQAGRPVSATVTYAPIAAAGGGGGTSGGAVYGPTAAGSAATQPPVGAGWVDSSGNVRNAAPATPLPEHDYDQRATGQSLSAANGSFVDVPVDGRSVVGLRFAGLAASGATVTYFSSNDATQTPASPISAYNAATGVTSPTRTTDGETRVPVSGRTTLRLQVTTGGTGTITVSWNVSRAGTIVDLGSPIPPGTNAIGTVAANQSGAWTVASTQSGAWTVAATQSGTWSVAQSGTWTVGLSAGSNTIGAVTQASGPWTVSWTGQTVAATQSGAWSATGNAAVTTAAPTYATGTTQPLSLNTQGFLRALVATDASAQGPSLSPATALGVVQQDGQTLTLSTAAAGPLIGTGTDQTTGAIATAGYQGVSIQGGSGTVTLQGSNDGSNWTNDASMSRSDAQGIAATTSAVVLSTTIIYRAPLNYRYVRFQGSGAANGTVTLKITPAPIGTFATPSVGAAAATPSRTAEVGSSTAADGITPVVTQAGTSAVGKAAQGNLYSAYAVNGTTTAGYLVAINAAAVPSAGAAIVPVDVAYLAGTVGATASINYGAGPPNAYSTGIVLLVTTSLTTYAAGGNAFIQVRPR